LFASKYRLILPSEEELRQELEYERNALLSVESNIHDSTTNPTILK